MPTQDSEYYIRADNDDLIPYIRGYHAAGGALPSLLFADEHGVLTHNTRDRIRHRGEVVHVIMDSNAREELATALAKAAPLYQWEIVEELPILDSSFRFSVRTPSRKVADEIENALTTLPAGVVVRGFSPREKVDPESGGTSIYSPTHEYDFRGSGTIEGPIRAVIEARARLCAIDFVDCEEIELRHA